MCGTVRAKNVHLLARPCVKAAYAACGCDSDARGGRKLYTNRHTHTRGTATVTIILKIIRIAAAQ